MPPTLTTTTRRRPLGKVGTTHARRVPLLARRVWASSCLAHPGRIGGRRLGSPLLTVVLAAAACRLRRRLRYTAAAHDCPLSRK